MTLFVIVYFVVVTLLMIRPVLPSRKNKKAETEEITQATPANKTQPRSWATREILQEYAKVPESMRDEDVAGILEDLDRLNGVGEATSHFRTNGYLDPMWTHYEDITLEDLCDREDSKNMCNPYWEVKKAVDDLVRAGKEQEALLKEQSPEYTQVKSLTQRLNQSVTVLTESNKELKGG